MPTTFRSLAPLAVGLVFTLATLPADAAEEPKALRACIACHTFQKGGSSKIGPNLYGIAGSKAAAVPGFDKYGDSMKIAAAKGLTWTPANLDAYIADPVGFLKAAADRPDVRTNMIARIRKPEERAAIVGYLLTLKD